mmetsp:Transcript_20961/g.43745  ORF Transcript_20961/g.43745 Transcript_20961/m.43745 type:complete len:145 (-) Transcript_20961:119-553(-)
MFLTASQYSRFNLAMFGFFSLGMLYDNAYVFGPSSPFGWPMIYWTESGADQDGAAYWWSRLNGAVMLSLFSGPPVFNAPLAPYLKQTMFASFSVLVIMIYHTKISNPQDCIPWIWNAQIALQVYLVVCNAKLCMKGEREIEKLD